MMRLLQRCALLLLICGWLESCEAFQFNVRSLSHQHHPHHLQGQHEPARNGSFLQPRASLLRLTTTASDNNNNNEGVPSHWQRAIRKFKSRPGTYLLIPCIAALVGWFTNWLAVQMIFYPIKFRGIPLWVPPESPMGLLGWQGIVPCKTRPMTQAMVHMVSTHLLTVQEVFQRLDPTQVASILGPQIPTVVQEMVQEILPMKWMYAFPKVLSRRLQQTQNSMARHMTKDFIQQLTIGMQQNIDSIFNLQNCVVNQMLQDRSMLGQLFQKCGTVELEFLTNSGLWFGFMLGIIQMTVALFWDNPWTLSVGGGIVGMATNWLALKWIFQPVDPTKIGPFILQGQFLRRQNEVSVEFSKFFANKILTAEQLWSSVLTDPSTSPAFTELFESHVSKLLRKASRGIPLGVAPATLRLATTNALAKLPTHLPVLYPYMDKTLGLETTLRERMMKMTSRQFERVLHPIFEEDELTLILAGAALGFAAGLVQQGLETGAIKMPNVWKPLRRTCLRIQAPFRRWLGWPSVSDNTDDPLNGGSIPQ